MPGAVPVVTRPFTVVRVGARQLDMSTVISVRLFTGFAVEGFVWHLHATEGRDLYTLVATEADCRSWVRWRNTRCWGDRHALAYAAAC